MLIVVKSASTKLQLREKKAGVRPGSKAAEPELTIAKGRSCARILAAMVAGKIPPASCLGGVVSSAENPSNRPRCFTMMIGKRPFPNPVPLVLLRFALVALLLCPTFPVAASDLPEKWKPVSGDWDLRKVLTGYRAGDDWGLVLTEDWYGDFEIAGEVNLKKTQGSHRVSVVFRHAGPSESYGLIIDPRSGEAELEEKHSGDSQKLVAITSRELIGASRLSFAIRATGESVQAIIWPAKGTEKDALLLASSDIKVPEGRLGLGVLNCEASFSISKLAGGTDSKLPVYAFRHNYRLPDRLAKEPMWQYLDAVASSVTARSNGFKSASEFETHRANSLTALRRSLGLDPWPDRTPLNAKIVGVVDRSDFKIEKVLFESQPGFFVNALLYLPKHVNGRLPGVLSTIGHYGDSGFFMWSEQSRCIGLARKGYVVLTYDPISQGERKWLGNDHDKLRRKTILAGMEVSGLMVWDSIRAIDYLSSRPEVDPDRIGVTGVSGGGFNALYTAILDSRVKAVAPAGFSTTLEALVKRGHAGCCAYLPDMGVYTDYPELYSLIAPRGLLLLGGYHDFLSDRILDVYETARKAYSLHGAQHNVKYFLDPNGGHTYSKPMRLALYRWFNKWLKNIDDPALSVEILDPEDSLISKESGLLKVFTDDRPGKDVTQLLKARVAEFKARYKRPSTPDEVAVFQEGLRAELVALMGDMGSPRPPVVVSDDKTTMPGSIRRVIVETERNLPVPVSIYHPGESQSQKPLILFLSLNEGSDALKRIRALVAQGFVVAAPEVRGSGPTLATGMDSVAMYCMALGKHLFSTRIYDLQRVTDYLLDQERYRTLPLLVWGEGAREGLMALYLAAIDPRMRGAISSHGLVDYQHVVSAESLPEFDSYLPGILMYADVPEIIAAIAPRRVIVHAPTDIDKATVSDEAAVATYKPAKSVYRILGVENAFSIVSETALMSLLGEEWPD